MPQNSLDAFVLVLHGSTDSYRMEESSHHNSELNTSERSNVLCYGGLKSCNKRYFLPVMFVFLPFDLSLLCHL